MGRLFKVFEAWRPYQITRREPRAEGSPGPMPAREYDAIIVGASFASFAGLAVARELRMPGAWLGPLAELGNHPAIRGRWWPRYLRFGQP